MMIGMNREGVCADCGTNIPSCEGVIIQGKLYCSKCGKAHISEAVISGSNY